MHHSLSLQSSDASIALNDVLGRIAFAASNETGSDALKVAAIVSAIAEGNFDATSNPTSLVFSTGHSETATEKMRITSQGLVGINTSSPSSKLEIDGDGSTTDDGIITVNDPSSGGTTSWIKLFADDGSDDLTWHIAYGDTSMFKDLEFRTSFSAVPEVTIEPSSTLNLDSGGTSTKRFKAYDFYSTTYNTAALPAYTFANDLDTGMWLASANNLCFSTAGTERLRISSADNVGINTSNPLYTLDILGTARIEPTTSHGMLLGRSGGTSSIRATGADAPSEYLILDSNGNYLSLNHYTSDNIVMAYGGGNVGIATVSPTQKLHVQGNIKLSTGGVGAEDDGLFMSFPGGATDSNSGSTQTGYLKVQLPVSWTNTMISFDLDIYEYNANGNAAIRKLRLGGYNYTNQSWVRTIAIYDGSGAVDHNLKAHFGHDGSKCAIYISKVSTAGVDSGASSSWSYAQAFVTNVFGGYSATTMANWADGWDVTFTTSLGTITATHEVNRPFKLNDSSYVFNELGNNVDVRIESENLDYLIHTDANKDEVVIHNAVGYGLNYATPEGWIEGNGTQVGYYGGSFNRNGASAENFCEFGDLPNGMRGLLWKSRNNTTDNSADGGWTKNVTGVDPEKTYVSIVYVRRVGSSTTGSFYHGCGTGGSATYNMAGVSTSNPYFHAFNIATLPQDVWCVSIGIIHAHSDSTTTSTGIGGVYRLDSGVKLGITNQDYRMGPTATVQNHRTFLYYDTAGTSALDWCWPGFYEVTADAVTGLLNTILYDHFSGRNIVINENGDNYDFRVEGDGEQNLLFVDASTDRVGVHTAFPQKDFHVQGTTALRGGTILGSASIPIASQSIKVVDDSLFSDTATFNTDIVASSGVTLSSAIPATTTNKLYNDAGTLMWDGSEVGSGGGSSNLVRGSFAVTSSTTVFTVSGGYSTGSLDVYQNGVKLFKGSSYDFTETGGGTTFTLANAATNGDLIEYVALNASTSATGNTSLSTVSVTSNQTDFSTTDTISSTQLVVFLNGVKLVEGTSASNADYEIVSSNLFRLHSTAVSGDVVEYIIYGATVASSNLAKTGDTMTGNLTVNADLIVTGYKETHTDNGNTGTAQTIDISDSTLQTYTLTGNCTFTMPTADAGRSFTMFLKTGAGSFTSTFTGVKFPLNTAPTITTDANRMDLITFYSDGTNWYGNIQQEYHV